MSIDKSKKISFDSGFFSEKSVIIAKSGYGKSYTARVIIEEGLKLGNTFIIIDPQEAYLNLENFDYIDAKNVKSAKGLGLLISQSNKNVVISTKGLGIESQNKFLNAFLREYRKNIRKGIQTIVIDEAHKFAPEQNTTFSKDVVRAMFQENRSDGLGCIAITQRIARLDKTIISQANNNFIGRVTSHVDKNVIKQYLDDPDDILKISKLPVGDFYVQGIDDIPLIVSVRESETEHSGSAPTNLLREDMILYSKHINRFVKKDKSVKKFENNNVGENNKMDPIKEVGNLVPSKSQFIDFAKLGMKVSLGLGLSGLASNLIASKFRSPIPYVSSRSLGSLATSISLFALHKAIKNDGVKDVLKYATAGSTVYTAGSLVFDLISLTKIRIPALASTIISSATGVNKTVLGVTNSSAESMTGEDVDLDTIFA